MATRSRAAEKASNDGSDWKLDFGLAPMCAGTRGHARTSDGRLDIDLDVPSEMGGSGGRGTNPEQLFAAGYGACFHSALLRIAVSASRVISSISVSRPLMAR